MKSRKKPFRLGPNLLIEEYDSTEGCMTWYDGQGNQVTPLQVEVLKAWYSMAPVFIRFCRKKEDPIKEYDDIITQRQIERLLGHQKYQDALKMLLEYCAENTEDFYIRIVSYVSGEEGYISVGYLFQYFAGCSRIVRVRYKDDDVDKAIINTKELATEEDFIDFCSLKYGGDNFVYIEGIGWDE